MSSLIKQIIKFGIVGIIATLLDMVLYVILSNVFHVYYVTASIISFSISLLFNYCLSMKYVFVANKNLSKQKQFIIFVVLSLIGCVLNALVLYLTVDMVYMKNEALMEMMNEKMAKFVAKMFATGVTMVYNFITKKIFLEERKKKK